jgi:hypothetical protein
MVQQSCDFADAPQLKLEEWAASTSRICAAAGLLRSTGGGDDEGIDRNAFAGWMRQLSVYGVAASAIKIQCGLAAADHGGNTSGSSGRVAMFASLPRIVTPHHFRSLAGAR